MGISSGVIGAIGSIGGALIGSNSANQASNAQQQGNAAAIAEQAREFDAAQARSQPWVTAGTNALGTMQSLNSGDFSKFFASPDYQFTYDQGLKALDASAASHGRLDSGGYGMDLTNYGQGAASTQYGTFYNREAALAGLGQTSVNNINTLGANTANQIGGYNVNAGNARASGYAAQGNIWGNALGQLGGLFSQQNNGGGYDPAAAANGYGGGYGTDFGWGG